MTVEALLILLRKEKEVLKGNKEVAAEGRAWSACRYIQSQVDAINTTIEVITKYST